ncbi:IclR family transcriptional regulator [Jiangella asiatica]|nr:IclR family transcriptional regulator [Jiangella asiatica]
MEVDSHQVEAEEATQDGGVRSVRRALSLLSALGSDGRTLTELASAAGISLSTASRLLGTLRMADFVAQREDGAYVPGRELTSLLYATDPWAGIRSVAARATRTLRDQLDETAAFFVLTGNDCLCIESSESTRLVRRVCPPGERRPVYLGAAGKALLTFSATPPAGFGLRESDETFTTATGAVRTVAELRSELTEIAARGWSFSSHESTLESWAVAAPVRSGGTVIGVLTAVVPATRDGDDYVARVVAATVDAAAAVR